MCKKVTYFWSQRRNMLLFFSVFVVMIESKLKTALSTETKPR